MRIQKTKNHGYGLNASLAIAFGVFVIMLPLHRVFGQQVSRIDINASEITGSVTDWLFGSCIEDVNHEIYGGLYGQLLFGESFEEPRPSADFEGWKTWGGHWDLTGQTVSVNNGPGYKMVKTDPVFKDGIVEADVNIKNGVIGGLLVRVKNAGEGMDEFDGYEVSLNYQTQQIILGKHMHNWQPLSAASFSFDTNQWVHLKVVLKGARLQVFTGMGGSPLIDFVDKKEVLSAGRLALRTFNGNVAFRRLIIRQEGSTSQLHFVARSRPAVSAMWRAVNTDGKGSFQLDSNGVYNGNQCQVIVRAAAGGKTGVANSGLNHWGIAVRKGQHFSGHVYLRSEGLKGTPVVAIQRADGKMTYAQAPLQHIGPGWKKYSFHLVSEQSDPKARFVIYIEAPGKLWIDQAVLMAAGDDRFTNLHLRADIAGKMKQEGLRFLRYGGSMVNAPGYRWQNMIGDVDKRPPYKGTWYPYSSNGFAIEEFLWFCEAADFEPAFAINIEESPETVYNMVRYLNSDTTTKAGKQRAENGHPTAYHVKYIEIGNEEVIHADDIAQYEHYIHRFLSLYQAIHRADSSIKLINAAWWRPDSPSMERVFRALDGKAAYWDLHVWADAADAGKVVDSTLSHMHSMFLKWNPMTTMKCAILEENGNLHNQQRALGHASVLNAVRRHGDFVLTSCAANALQPLGQNDNGWDQGQIFFTPDRVWGMPPFYAQQMAAENHEPLVVQDQVTGPLDVTATRSTDGHTLVIHVVNPSAEKHTADIIVRGIKQVAPLVEAFRLSGPLDAVNTASEPTRISTHKKSISIGNSHLQYQFEPHSYTILRMAITM